MPLSGEERWGIFFFLTSFQVIYVGDGLKASHVSTRIHFIWSGVHLSVQWCLIQFILALPYKLLSFMFGPLSFGWWCTQSSDLSMKDCMFCHARYILMKTDQWASLHANNLLQQSDHTSFLFLCHYFTHHENCVIRESLAQNWHNPRIFVHNYPRGLIHTTLIIYHLWYQHQWTYCFLIDNSFAGRKGWKAQTRLL